MASTTSPPSLAAPRAPSYTTSFAALAFVCVAAALAPPSAAAGAQATARQRAVDAIFADVDSAHTPGCAVAVIEGGVLAYARGYGAANLEYGIPVTPTSVFHAASLAKQFTAMAVALLVQEGRVSWEDDVREYVPELPEYRGKTITLRDLAQHISGIRDQWELLMMAGWRWEADVVTQEDVLHILSRQKALNFEPGHEFLYSNSGYTLLAVVLERVTGQTLREYARERIFEPLGMDDTGFRDDHGMIVRNRAFAYAPDSILGLKISIPDFDVVGASSLFTTVEDLARWDRNFYTGDVGGPQALLTLHGRGILVSGETTDYGHGLSLGSYRGLATVGHSGADAGYRAYYARFPEHDFSAAVLCNFAESAPWARAHRVADIYLADAFAAAMADLSVEWEEAVELPDEALQELAGYYAAPHTDIPLRVTLGDGVLYLGWESPQLLIALGEGKFKVASSQTVVRFDATDGGAVRLRIPRGFGEWIYTRGEAPDTSSQVMAEYRGRYYSEELGALYEVRMEDEALVFWNRKLGSMALRPTHRDGFSFQSYSATFTRDADGVVDGFTLSSPRVRKVRFEKEGRG